MEENSKPKVLYLDDEQDNLLVFKASFRRFYDVYTAESGKEGLAIVENNDIAVIITDQRMPGMTGVEFLKQLPEELMAIRMVLTGYSDVASIIEAINSGKVYRYITKPWDRDELKMTIDNAIEAHQLKRKNQDLIAELQKTNEKLEEKVKERTIELAEALEDLQELNATKDKFFSIVAHDLRSPVTSLVGFSSMLADHGDKLKPEEISTYAKDLNLSVRNTLTLIENLLIWAKQQMNRIQHDPVELSLSEIIPLATQQARFQAAEKNITLEHQIDASSQMFADKEQLTLVLRNLLTNAIKFTEQEGKVTVYGSCSQGKSILKISDTGVGMSTEQLNNLFSLEHNQSTKGTAGEKGTGLGLILCKEFIEKNGGELLVESQEGVGTTFTVKLPAYASKTEAESQEQR
jgi:signal transduction histidine kinase